MITISQVASTIIENSPFLEDGLKKGIINISALARLIKPEIEKKLHKKIESGAIIVALNRLNNKLSARLSESRFLESIGNITVRSKITEVTFGNSSSLFEAQKKLYNRISQNKDLFCSFSQGVRETTLIINSSLEDLVGKIFADEKVIYKYSGLSSVTITYPVWIVETPGFYYIILKLLAWHGINIFEIISTYTELTILVSEKDVERTFALLNRLRR
ncbi:MAG: hypothetical protein UV73_C0001G0274 [Candidatus Gottesmanbacteria bacterium GW2011_GWA2_43_14]|uniref:Aspartate kinase n=1 Tax=Candidatus Gottesmanbacteria bacterium GW2011_GWA2_43_14 TaxID=1618443 RepID=A0A0G1GJ09_9BACT|nr:MAG: hypothetical protein UV73_C0001G0274 [Candidatus Gottesmanbacteria bacterium GW2011_GWA2_43_14]